MKHRVEKKAKILLIDDEAGIRTVLKITLESSGYEVCLAPDGDSGFIVFEQEKPDIVVTDIKMPGISGIELLKKIKNQSPETEVIMITGHGDMDLAVQSLQYEAADFITKPIDIDVLESAIKKAEERISISRNIKHYMDDLETLVEEKDKKINESEKLITIGQTIAGMSHAIKNISGGLKGGAFVLEQGIEQENREYLKQGWAMMKGNIDKITKLSLDLLNYAKTTTLDFKAETPNTPAREVMHLMNHRAKELGISFKLSPCSQKRLVWMDKEAIHNCLLTLVTNAFDSFNGIEDARWEKQVHVTVATIGKTVEYSVRDTGRGIKESIQPAIFNDFITTKGINGTGFGLMTTRKIIEEHQGEISFTTQQDVGTEFIIRIPSKPLPTKHHKKEKSR